jgi:large subunit ribosomal protein L10
MLKTAGAMLNGEVDSLPAEASGLTHALIAPCGIRVCDGVTAVQFSLVPNGVFCFFRGRRFYFVERRDVALAIKRERKVELLDIYRAEVKKSSALVFTNYRGLSVANLQSLRVKLGETNTGFMVVKNTLLGIALEENGLPNPDSLLSGPNAVAFVGEDIGRSVKSILDWIKAEKIGEVSGALLGNSVLDAKNAELLADLPSKDQVRAMLLGAINAPASSLARIVSAPTASLARVINAHAEQNSEAA